MNGAVGLSTIVTILQQTSQLVQLWTTIYNIEPVKEHKLNDSHANIHRGTLLGQRCRRWTSIGSTSDVYWVTEM